MKTQIILKWALVLGIVIVLNLFFNYSIALVYEEPMLDQFCKQEQVVVEPKTQEQCVGQGGQWTEQGVMKGENVARPVMVDPSGKEVPITGYCNLYYTCQKEFDDYNKIYSRNVFIILVALGVISLGISFAIASTPAVSLGLSLGGVLSLIIASTRYWQYMEGYLRVIVLGLALAALIWLGIKKIKE
jgi:hypothetical protein